MALLVLFIASLLSVFVRNPFGHALQTISLDPLSKKFFENVKTCKSQVQCIDLQRVKPPKEGQTKGTREHLCGVIIYGLVAPSQRVISFICLSIHYLLSLNSWCLSQVTHVVPCRQRRSFDNFQKLLGQSSHFLKFRIDIPLGMVAIHL